MFLALLLALLLMLLALLIMLLTLLLTFLTLHYLHTAPAPHHLPSVVHSRVLAPLHPSTPPCSSCPHVLWRCHSHPPSPLTFLALHLMFLVLHHSLPAHGPPPQSLGMNLGAFIYWKNL